MPPAAAWPRHGWVKSSVSGDVRLGDSVELMWTLSCMWHERMEETQSVTKVFQPSLQIRQD